LVDIKSENKSIAVTIMKGLKEDIVPEAEDYKTDKAMVLFSGDLDKALAAFIIANGAAAMGRNVTIFFTFWGLNVLRKSERINVKKTIIEKMFGFMMPRGSKKMTLSKMNMLGMGTGMIKYIMNQKNVDTLEVLMDNALKNGVKLVACTMSMDLMGIKQEELIEGVELGGVASFLAASERSDSTLFI
jgi:peroxiredoxin family protein